MPIKNSTSKVPAPRSMAEIQDALVKHGATGVLYQYEQGTGRIEALQFLLRIKNQMSDVGMRRSTSTAWRGATSVIASWPSLLCMRPRLWTCRRYSYRLPRMRRDRRSVRRWWRGSFCWDRDRRKIKSKDPVYGNIPGLQHNICPGSQMCLPLKEPPPAEVLANRASQEIAEHIEV